jgi:hypothetical protein
MRTSVLALLAVGCLGLSACGSNDAAHDVVPSSLPVLTAPPGSSALAKPSGTSTNGASSSSGTTTGTTPQTTTGQSGTTTGTTPPTTTGQTPTGTTGGTGGAGTGGTGSGGTSGQTTTNGGTGGTSPGEFNQFCQDNPGACPGN